MTRVSGDRAVGDVLARIGERAHASVADVLEEGRLIDQPQDELRVRVGEFDELEPRRLDRDHWCSAQNGSTRRSTKFILR